MSDERNELRGTLANTICNASNYPKLAQPYLLGGDMSAVLDKAADAILAAGYRKPPTIDHDKLVIEDGLLLLDVGGCTCTPYGSSHENHCGIEYLDDLRKPLERAGYRKPRTVTTVDELDALPPLSVVLDKHGESFQKMETDEGTASPLWCSGDVVLSDLIDLPAKVLHVPGASS